MITLPRAASTKWAASHAGVIAALSVFLFCATCANAEVFKASGTFDDGATLSGTITVDTSVGTITASDLSVSAPDSVDFVDDIYAQHGNGAEYVFGSKNGDNFLEISLAVGSLVGYTGSQINNFSVFSNPNSGYNTYVTAGEFTPAPAPEPATVWLFGSTLAVGWLLRRRSTRTGKLE